MIRALRVLRSFSLAIAFAILGIIAVFVRFVVVAIVFDVSQNIDMFCDKQVPIHTLVVKVCILGSFGFVSSFE